MLGLATPSGDTSHARGRSLAFTRIEGDALSHAKVLRSLAEGLEPPRISPQIQLFIHRYLQAASGVHCHRHARLGADRRTVGSENGRPVLREPDASGEVRRRLTDARKRPQQTAENCD